MGNGILKVLSVDDDTINMKLLLRMLSHYPDLEGKIETNVITAVNGEDALKKLKENPDVNIILLDIQMPVMTGMEFLDVRMNSEDLSNIPVVVLTTDETKKNEALDKGATDFVTKPIKQDVLFDRLDMIKELYE